MFMQIIYYIFEQLPQPALNLSLSLSPIPPPLPPPPPSVPAQCVCGTPPPAPSTPPRVPPAPLRAHPLTFLTLLFALVAVGTRLLFAVRKGGRGQLIIYIFIYYILYIIYIV